MHTTQSLETRTRPFPREVCARARPAALDSGRGHTDSLRHATRGSSMIDLKILRERSEEVLAIYRDRLFDESAAELAKQILALDHRRRQITARADELKQRRNADSAVVGRERDPEKRKALIAQMDHH